MILSGDQPDGNGPNQPIHLSWQNFRETIQFNALVWPWLERRLSLSYPRATLTTSSIFRNTMTDQGRYSSYAPGGLLALSWLGSDDQGASLLTTAHDLLAAQDVIAATLPAGLTESCRVARLENGIITLAVPAAAHANKLRHLQTRMLAALHQAGWNVEQVRIRVQARLLAEPSRRLTREVQPLDDQALQSFDALKQHVAPGPLADAIERLLSRHGGHQTNCQS